MGLRVTQTHAAANDFLVDDSPVAVIKARSLQKYASTTYGSALA